MKRLYTRQSSQHVTWVKVEMSMANLLAELDTFDPERSKLCIFKACYK